MKKTRFVFYALVLVTCLMGLPLQGTSLFVSQSHAQGKKAHPVILVHGIGGNMENWTDEAKDDTIYHVLKADGYDMGLVWAFAYPPGPGQEDSYGDVRRTADSLAQEVERLSQQSVQAGGPAQVDIVAHSLGGLITRQYLGQHLLNHRIGKFIDMGTPHQGSTLMGGYNSAMDGVADLLTDNPVDNWITRQVIDLFVHEAWQLGQNMGIMPVPDPTSPAAQQLDPNSEFIRELSRPGQSPMNVDYSMLYGDITVRFEWDVFGIPVVSGETPSLGDLVVSRDNASTIPHLGTRQGPNPSNYHTYDFRASLDLELSLSLDTSKIALPGLSAGIENAGQVKSVMHTGFIRDPQVNQRTLTILNQGFVAQPLPITPVRPPASEAETATLLVLDVSDSMSMPWQGGIKIESARKAASDILHMIELESQSGLVRHQVGIATFSNDATLNLPLTTDYARAYDTIAGISPVARTNMGAGLHAANEALLSAPGGAKKIVILLSDGMTNEGLSEDQILNGPVQEAASAGTCIYTVGFGSQGDLDESLLREIAARSGCGEYYYANAAAELESTYIRLRHQSMGNIIAEFNGTVAQGQTVDVGTAQVPPGQGELYITENWKGSSLALIVTDPAGRRVDENYPGVTQKLYDRLAYLIVKNPAPGTWRVQTFGSDVPEGILEYNVMLSVRAGAGQPSPDAPGLILGFLVIAMVVAFAIVVISQQGGAGAPAVQVVRGAAVHPWARVGGRGLVIGRDPSQCGLVLGDPKVSRRHAQIVPSPAGYVITDLNSTSGTYVNGKRVAQATLLGAEMIKVGDSEIVFRPQR